MCGVFAESGRYWAGRAGRRGEAGGQSWELQLGVNTWTRGRAEAVVRYRDTPAQHRGDGDLVSNTSQHRRRGGAYKYVRPFTFILIMIRQKQYNSSNKLTK